MELDDFKNIWSEADTMEGKTLSYERIHQILTSVRRVKKRISNRFKIEIVIALIIYMSFILVVLLYKNDVQLFLYKLVVFTFIFTTPIYFRLYKSIQFLTQVNYGRDIKSNIIEFLTYYKTTLQFYKWSSYSLILVLIVLFFTDASFLELRFELQAIIIFYLLLVLAASGPLIKKFYSRDTKPMEDFLKD